MAGLRYDDAFPRLIPSKTHAVIDWLHVATNFAAAVYFWNRNRRASGAALFLGANVLVNTLMTDYEYGVFRAWSFKVHGVLDYGVALSSPLMPVLLGFATRPQANFFYVQGAVETLTAGVTDYDDQSGARNPEHLELPIESRAA